MSPSSHENDSYDQDSHNHNDADAFTVDDAYDLETPDDNRRLYRKWAATYDRDFVDGMGYVYPENVVGAFLDAGGSAGGVILDVGCGTGVVGVALSDVGEKNIDGVDISPEMIEVARSKTNVFGDRAYRDFHVADLTIGLDIADDTYMGIISAGTFTHGHLPPGVLHEIVRVASPAAVCAIGINADHYLEMGFDKVFAELTKAGQITSPLLLDVAVYEGAPADHADVRANIAMFQVTG